MLYKLGFSSCPNDTFMFAALVNQWIDTDDILFEVSVLDIDTLNQKVLKEELDISKISFNAFRKCFKKYELLDSGSALGNNCGPILVTLPKNKATPIKNMRIAIPGELTTANRLLDLAYPSVKNKVSVLFSEIESAILNGEVDAGILIHENRFTYREKGLIQLKDLGEFWKIKTNMLIPLGGIVVKNKINIKEKLKINNLMKNSIEYAFLKPNKVMTYVQKYAQGMDKDIIEKHIKLYVNQFSLSLGEEGKNSIKKFLNFKRNLQKTIFVK